MLSDELKNKVLQSLRDKTGLQSWTVNKSPIVARNCVVYRLSCDQHLTDIALKIYSNDQASRQLQSQYEVIKGFSETLNKKKFQYRVPEPYGSFVEDNCFLMEWALGESLDIRVWKYFYYEKKQFSDITKAYRWLKQYHQVANPILQKIDLNYFPDQLIEHIQKHNGQSLLENNVIFSEGLKLINEHGLSFSNLEVMHASLHGDFTPTNILIDKDAVTGIDIGKGSSQPIEIDMALMLNYIVIDNLNMLSKAHLKKAPETWSILNTVLDAYGYPRDKSQRQFFLFVFLFEMLRRWLILNNRNNKNPRLIDRWRLRNTVRIVAGISAVLTKQ